MLTFKQFLESELLNDFEPTETQKFVLLTLLAAQTEKLGADAIEGDVDITTAADILAKLGYIDVEPGSAVINDRGNQLLKDYYLVDESDQITDEGQKILQQRGGNAQAAAAPNGAEQPPAAPDAGGAPTDLGGMDQSMSGIPGI